MVLRVAITGGIACGKSLFSRYLSELGAELLDADDVVHGLEAPGGAAVPALVRLFGVPGKAVSAVRRLGLGAVQRSGPLKKFFMGEARGEGGELPKLLAGMEV